MSSPDYIVRGYGHDDRIAGRAGELLESPGIAYIHVRSARNNCCHCRIDRADSSTFSNPGSGI